MIAIVQGLTAVFNAIARLFGFEQPEFDYSSIGSGLSSVGSDAEDAASGISDVGSAAEETGKKIQKWLAPFDELNVLPEPDTDSGSGGGGSGGTGGVGGSGFDIPLPEYDMLAGYKGMFEEIFGEAFKPFQEAWNREGMATIGSIKYALGEIKNLFGVIGQSFREVWLNGTGTETLTLILSILQNIFNAVGDIAGSFARAWEEGGRGTQIIQNVWDALNSVLWVIDQMGLSFGRVWAQVGDEVAGAVLTALESLSGVLKNIGEAFINIWENGGRYFFEKVLEFGAKIIELGANIISNYIAPLLNGFIDLGGEGIGPLLGLLGDLLDKAIGLIDWLMNEGKPVLDIIVTAFLAWQSAIASIKLMELGTKAVDTANKILGLVSPTGKVADVLKRGDDAAAGLKKSFDTLKNGVQPVIDKVSECGSALGKTLKGEIDNLKPSLDTAKTGLKNIATNIGNIVKQAGSKSLTVIKNFAKSLGSSGLGTAAKTAATAIKTGLGGALTFIQMHPVVIAITAIIAAIVLLYTKCEWFRDGVNAVLGAIADFFVGVWDTIKGAVETIGGAIEGFFSKCEELGAAIGGFFEDVGAKWDSFKENVSNKVEELKTNVGEKWQSIKDTVSQKTDELKSNVSEKWTQLKDGVGKTVDTYVQNQEDAFGALRDFLTGDTEGMRAHLQSIWDRLPPGVQNTMRNLESGVVNIWNSLTGSSARSAGDIFNQVTGIFNNLRNTVSGVFDGIRSRITGVWDTIRRTLQQGFNIPMPHFNVSWRNFRAGKLSFSLPSLSVDWYAQGGFPDMGQLFIAREAGPEMVGNIGGRTAVANNDQIVQAVSRGVAQAVASVLSNQSSTGTSSEVVLEISGTRLAKIMLSEFNRMNRQNCVTVVPV